MRFSLFFGALLLVVVPWESYARPQETETVINNPDGSQTIKKTSVVEETQVIEGGGGGGGGGYGPGDQIAQGQQGHPPAKPGWKYMFGPDNLEYLVPEYVTRLYYDKDGHTFTFDHKGKACSSRQTTTAQRQQEAKNDKCSKVIFLSFLCNTAGKALNIVGDAAKGIVDLADHTLHGRLDCFAQDWAHWGQGVANRVVNSAKDAVNTVTAGGHAIIHGVAGAADTIGLHGVAKAAGGLADAARAGIDSVADVADNIAQTATHAVKSGVKSVSGIGNLAKHFGGGVGDGDGGSE